MKIFIQSFNNGIPRNLNIYCAYLGFKEMGFELVPFSHIDQLSTAEKCDIVVGHIGMIRQRLTALNLPIPSLGYPKELYNYLGRKIWSDTINHINNNPDLWPVFIKPYEDKRFTGVLVKSPKDFLTCPFWAGSLRQEFKSPSVTRQMGFYDDMYLKSKNYRYIHLPSESD